MLTVIGDDRAGLVAALSDVVSQHSGNWERSQMTELAGKFAGIVVVSVPGERAEGLTAALRTLDGLLEVSAYPVSEAQAPAGQPVVIDLLGNDRPGIVHEVSRVLHEHNLSIETIETLTREAPMAGGQLFEAHVVVRLPSGTDLDAVRGDLELLASELLVDITVDSP